MSTKRPPPKDLPPDIAADQVWRDASGQHYRIESVVAELATLQRCDANGTVRNQRWRMTRTGDQMRGHFTLVKQAGQGARLVRPDGKAD